MTLVAILMTPILGDCNPPPRLPFASPVHPFYLTRFKTGTALKYVCNLGYKKINSSHLTCNFNGEWMYPVFCVKKQCKPPGELMNGKVEMKSNLAYGSTIQFSCSKGYQLVGEPTSQCHIEGRGVNWSNPLPECVSVKCDSPPVISNGKHSGGIEEIFTYGSLVTYGCDPNFSLVGNASIFCSVVNKTIGVWSPGPPTCKKIICQKPQIPKAILASGFKAFYVYKDTIVISCMNGYVLRGSSSIRCEVNNQWYPSVPTCQPNGCTNLPDIPFASWESHIFPTKNVTIFGVGTQLKYQCKPGYRSVSKEPQTVICQENLTWTPSRGCEKVCCPKPNLENIRIISERRDLTHVCFYTYGDYIFYMCDKGYLPVSIDGRSSCQADGKWAPKTPSCKSGCNFPPSIAHGHHTRVSSYNIFKYEVLYGCDEGYTLVGPAKLSCSSSQWTPAAPLCKALCLKPEIENGKLSMDKAHYVAMENFTVHCDSGFSVVGPQNITCSEDGTWYPELPKCEWDVPEGCEQVLEGRKLMHCLASAEEVKMALEMYKLSLEVELLELQRDKARQPILGPPM
ncbi:PREDICTED: C4b-binding protein alpha chain-like [Dipodomys ordii]|uniref:C4b-binding protein alpha chain n=1 Tax=Dipodomys ordii TaxID=10020 RepID=A0A1S3FAA0_DIPOR|nr:PREDICTED: C4b-binding protein alpha chain-like [Dipodomys ordii]